MMSAAQKSGRSVVGIIPRTIEEHSDPQGYADFFRRTLRLFPVFLILRPTLGMNIDGFGACVAEMFRRVGNVATQSLIPRSDP